MNKSIPALCVGMALLAGCAGSSVQPVEKGLKLKEVCIIKNDKVIVPRFAEAVADRFAYHQIRTKMVTEAEASSCKTTATYTANMRWDVVRYLSNGEVTLWQNGKQLGKAHYRYRGGFSHWKSTESKMNPLIDEMLTGIKQR